MSSTLTSDYEAWEIGSAVIVATAIQFGVGVLIVLTSMAEAPMNEVDRGGEQAVRVIPVIDEEAFKTARLGGKKAVLPDMWNRAPASIKKKIQDTPPPPPIPAEPTPDPGENAFEVKPKSSAETQEDAGPPPPDADVEEGADAGQTASNEDAGSPTLDPDGGTSGPGGPGCTGPGCDKDGGLDDFIGAQYNGRLVSFFRRGFSVSGIGLPEDEIKKLMVSCSVSLSGDGSVTAATCGSTGNGVFDAAAKAHMQSKVGQQIPPPPEDRPDLKRSSLPVTLSCASGCN